MFQQIPQFVSNSSLQNQQFSVLDHTQIISYDDLDEILEGDVIYFMKDMSDETIAKIKRLELSIVEGKCERFTNLVSGYPDNWILTLIIRDRGFSLFDNYYDISFLPDEIIEKYINMIEENGSYAKYKPEEAMRLGLDEHLNNDMIRGVFTHLSDESIKILKKTGSKFKPSDYVKEIVMYGGTYPPEVHKFMTDPNYQAYPLIDKYKLYDEILTEKVFNTIVHIIACKFILSRNSDDSMLKNSGLFKLVMSEMKSIESKKQSQYISGCIDSFIGGMKHEIMRDIKKLVSEV